MAWRKAACGECCFFNEITKNLPPGTKKKKPGRCMLTPPLIGTIAFRMACAQFEKKEDK